MFSGNTLPFSSSPARTTFRSTDSDRSSPLKESPAPALADRAGEPRPILLPEVTPGDLLVLRDTGAYGLSMASNYNGFPLPAEVLVEGGVPRLVRRRQTLDDLLAPEREASA